MTHSVVLNSQVYSKIYVKANKRNIFAQLIYCFYPKRPAAAVGVRHVAEC